MSVAQPPKQRGVRRLLRLRLRPAAPGDKKHDGVRQTAMMVLGFERYLLTRICAAADAGAGPTYVAVAAARAERTHVLSAAVHAVAHAGPGPDSAEPTGSMSSLCVCKSTTWLRLKPAQVATGCGS